MSEEKKGAVCLGSWGERKKRASEEKKGGGGGGTVSVVWAGEKIGRKYEESTCHKYFLVLESYKYSYPGGDPV